MNENGDEIGERSAFAPGIRRDMVERIQSSTVLVAVLVNRKRQIAVDEAGGLSVTK